MGKKVVYYIGHYGGFYLCLIHKANYYPQSEALFIYVSTYSSNPTNEFMERVSVKKNKTFGEIVCMDESIFWGCNNKDETQKKIIRYYDELLCRHGFEVNKDTDVYMNFDEFNSMGIYLNYKKPRGIVGIITTSIVRLVSYVDMYIFNEIENRLFYTELQRECKTLEKDGPYVTKVIRTFSIDNISGEDIRDEAIDNAKGYEYFDLEEAKKNISLSQRNELQNIFEVDKIMVGKNEYNMFLLSSNFTAFKLSTSMEEFIYGNQMLVDYCLGNKPLLIKPHPRADYGEDIWKKYFSNCTYIPSYLPAEYLEVLDINMDTLLATGSVGGNYVKKLAKRIINFDRTYWWNYRYLHRLYISLCMAAYLGYTKLYYFGIPVGMLESLVYSNVHLQVFEVLNNIQSVKEISDNAFLLLNIKTEMKNDRNTWINNEIKNCIRDFSDITLCFIRESKYLSASWNEPIIKSRLLTFDINQESANKKIIKQEKIYLYCSRNEVYTMLQNYSCCYRLKNAGMNIQVVNENHALNSESDDLNILYGTMQELHRSFSHIDTVLNSLLSFSDERMLLIHSFEEYISELLTIDKLIILSVRDTPGHRITPDLATTLKGLGIQSDLHSKHWYSYLALIDNKRLVYEKIDAEHSVTYATELWGNKIWLKSAALKHGNQSIIEINDIDYSVNLRGINIVVFDCKRRKVIDSVCFDTHVSGIPCYRKKKKII